MTTTMSADGLMLLGFSIIDILPDLWQPTDGHLDIYHAAVHMMDKLEKIIHLPWESFRCPKTELVPPPVHTES